MRFDPVPGPHEWAVTVRQPWASLIVMGLKRIEVRRWRTAYRGRLWIHAAKTIDAAASAVYDLGDLPCGSLLGSVELADVKLFTPEAWDELRCEHHDAGQFQSQLFGWHLISPVRLQRAVPMGGQQRLFPLSGLVIETLQHECGSPEAVPKMPSDRLGAGL